MYDKYSGANSEKQRIFDIAVKLMEKIGYEDLSIRKICREAGISTGKFYIYFDNKQDLLNHYYEEAEKKVAKEAYDKFNNLEIKEAIVEFYKWYMKYTASFGVEFVINYFNPRNVFMDITSQSNFIMNMTDRLLEKEIQNGYKLPGGKSIHQLSQQICMIVKGVIFTWAAAHGNFSLPETTADILSAALVGILPETPKQ